MENLRYTIPIPQINTPLCFYDYTDSSQVIVIHYCKIEVRKTAHYKCDDEIKIILRGVLIERKTVGVDGGTFRLLSVICGYLL
jgi:hypothetical protein